MVDGAVNGSGAVAGGTGGALRPLQSGKVNQYGALLFGAAAVGALVLVIVNTLEGTDMNVLSDNNWLLSVGTFLPLAGVLVMLFIPRREELLIKQVGLLTALGDARRSASYTLVQFDYDQAGDAAVLRRTRSGSSRSRATTRSASTASACRCTSCRWSSPCW